MKRPVIWTLSGLLSLTVLGCYEAESFCISGEYNECSCDGDETGYQQCQPDNTWSDCECGGDTDIDADTDADTDSDSDTDTDNDSDTDVDTDADADTDCNSTWGSLDENTGLCWQHPEASGYYNWQGEMDYCDTLTLGGHNDWHLPSRQDFVDMLGGCDSDVLAGNEGLCNSCDESSTCSALFGNDSFWYWSSSAYDSYFLWAVYFDTGEIFCSCYDNDDASVRCVRSGP